jgi:hypothetical protein
MNGYSGVAWISNGKRNGAYQFDGIDDYMYTDKAFTYNKATRSAWINVDPTESNARILGGHRTSATYN